MGQIRTPPLPTSAKGFEARQVWKYVLPLMPPKKVTMARTVARWRTLASTIAVSLLAALPCAADWHRVDSPNFVVIGDLSGGDLRTVAKKFEGFRETLSRVLSDNVTATAVPTIVIVFPSDRSFTPFKPRYEGKVVSLSGIFVGRQDINYIGVVSGGDESLRIVFHAVRASGDRQRDAEHAAVAERRIRRLLQHV